MCNEWWSRSWRAGFALCYFDLTILKHFCMQRLNFFRILKIAIMSLRLPICKLRRELCWAAWKWILKTLFGNGVILINFGKRWLLRCPICVFFQFISLSLIFRYQALLKMQNRLISLPWAFWIITLNSFFPDDILLINLLFAYNFWIEIWTLINER